MFLLLSKLFLFSVLCENVRNVRLIAKHTHTRKLRVFMCWCAPLIQCSNPTDDRLGGRTSAPSAACLPNWLKQNGTQSAVRALLFCLFQLSRSSWKILQLARGGGTRGQSNVQSVYLFNEPRQLLTSYGRGCLRIYYKLANAARSRRQQWQLPLATCHLPLGTLESHFSSVCGLLFMQLSLVLSGSFFCSIAPSPPPLFDPAQFK